MSGIEITRWRAADSFFFQDLYGVAGAADPNDTLDVTTAATADEVATIQTSDSTKTKIPGLMAATGTAADGLSLGQKLFFIGGIVGVCALFLRSKSGANVNNGNGLFKDKSMA